LTETIGRGFTFTVIVAVLLLPVQVVPSVARIEYVVVTVGFAITVAPVVVFSPVGGDQEYVAAPLAVIVTELPRQIVGLTTEKETVTCELMLTWILSEITEPLQPPEVTVNL
jgi:hypothetical protein